MKTKYLFWLVVAWACAIVMPPTRSEALKNCTSFCNWPGGSPTIAVQPK